MEKICAICEEYHNDNEFELVTGGVEDGIVWKRFKCLRTGEEWENWSSPNKRMHLTLRLWAWLKNLIRLGSRR
jgi:hypothetical protein